MPKGYIYAELEVTDQALFDTYRPLAAASVAAFGGRYAIRRAGSKVVLEGGGAPPSFVLLEFESPERAMEWYNSPEYQAALQIRERSAKSKVALLIGDSNG